MPKIKDPMENNLGNIIKSKGIMKGWIAEKAGVSRNTITALYKGQEPHLRLAYKISKLLNVTIYDIWPNLENLD